MFDDKEFVTLSSQGNTCVMRATACDKMKNAGGCWRQISQLTNSLVARPIYSSFGLESG
jgi:hypothetical protein